MRFGDVLGVRVGAVTMREAVDAIVGWLRDNRQGYVCAAPVHSIMEAYDHPDFREILNGALLVVPDGMPLAWSLRKQGFRKQPRVPGPDLMWELCARAEAERIRVGLFGGSEDCLRRLQLRMKAAFPSLEIVYAYSPPFRSLTPEEDSAVVRAMHSSNAEFVFVGLGCPKQERWMQAHSPKLSAILFGVGAAFDFHAGLVRKAPKWLQNIGLEWAFRLLMEPRRLWKRYAKHNPRFLYYNSKDLRSRRSKGVAG